jgi:hypothetical protein
MERLHSVIAFWVLSLGLASASAAAQTTYCSLRVRALSPDGRRPAASIVVEEKSGRKIEKDQESADVSFCDLGILPVTVTVGDKGCNQVVVKDVPLEWQEPYLLVVTYDVEPCVRETPRTFPTCQVLLRVSDAAGHWLKASLKPDGGGAIQETDDAGRARVVMKLDQKLQGGVTSTGHTEKRISLECSRDKLIQEEIVVLGSR